MASASSKKKSMVVLSADDILGLDDLEIRDVLIPEWGENKGVKVRALTKAQQQKARNLSTKKGMIDDDLLEMNMLIEGIHEPKFTAEQIEQLRGKNTAAVDRILGEIYEMSGLTEAAMLAAAQLFRDQS